MNKVLTISELTRKFDRDRTTILRWIERGLFPNARLEESPVGSYWLVPESDFRNFTEPKQGRPRKQILKAA